MHQINVQSAYTKIPAEGYPILNMRSMKRLQNLNNKVGDFLPKPVTAYGLSGFNSKYRNRDSDSD